MSMTPNDDAHPQIYLTIHSGTDNTGQPVDGLFDGFLGHRQLCASTRPLRDATLALIDLGIPPEATLIARNVVSGRQVAAMLASAAAGLVTDFNVEGVVLPFRRKPMPILGSGGGDAA